MTTAFPDVDPLAVDVTGARPAADPDTGAEAIEIAVQADDDDPLLLSLSVCAAYQLREALDEALEAPFWWEGASDDERFALGIARKTDSALRAAGVVDLDRARSVRADADPGDAEVRLQDVIDGRVRWDEPWAPSPSR